MSTPWVASADPKANTVIAGTASATHNALSGTSNTHMESSAHLSDAVKAASARMPRFLEYSTDPLVSSDIIGNPASCIFDSLSTMVSGTMVKTFAWYDNEWGYSNRVVDLMAHASSVRS